MNDEINKTLLPTGLRDVLPPDAAIEAAVAERLMAEFAANGYARVKPPLIEFEDSLLTGSGATLAAGSFRMVDPASQRMLAVRGDITLQAARIATSRMARHPRPLRLSYAGQVLRAKGTQLRPERQFAQAGIELIGSTSPAADAEVVLVVAEALRALGLRDISVDINLPTLVPAVCDALGLAPDIKDTVRAALDHKDAPAVDALGGEAGRLFGALIRAVGPADKAMAALLAVDLPRQAAAERARLAEVVALVRAGAPGLAVTVDPVEHRGFEYHTGVSFSIFGQHGELGRGGRYRAGASGEPATGATLFLDRVLDGAPKPPVAPVVYAPFGTSRDEAARLRAQGLVVVAGLEAVADARAEAARLGCGHIFADGKAVALS